MNRRRFLAFLGALGPGLALARAGMGGGAPLTITTPWIKFTGPALAPRLLVLQRTHADGTTTVKWLSL